MGKGDIELIVRGVWRHRGKLLVCQNRKRGHVFLPGGHVEVGESAAAALAREIMEELGVAVTVGRFLGVSESIFEEPRDRQPPRRVHEVNLVFEVRPPRRCGVNPLTLRSRERKIRFRWPALRQLEPPPSDSGMSAADRPSVPAVAAAPVARTVRARSRRASRGTTTTQLLPPSIIRLVAATRADPPAHVVDLSQ